MKKRVMNLVNFVRGCEPRQPWQDLYTPVAEELRIDKSYGFPHTFLLQYDALLRKDFQELFLKERDDKLELGLWFEMGRPLTEAVGIEWRGRPGYDWDWYVDPGFLVAYTPKEREALIDEAFRLFKEIFGEYPKVAGSWLLDAYSMAYMSDKYDMKAFCMCREQFAVDAYTLWGGYYNGGYFPSRTNMLCPAQHEETKIKTPVFRMLGIDPVYGYDEAKYSKGLSGCPTMEPVWASGCNGAIMDWYFRTYYENPCLSQAYATTGQENSFGWPWIGPGYVIQTEKLADLARRGVVTMQKLGDAGQALIDAGGETPATAMVATDAWDGNDIQSVWYSCRNYRCNLFCKDGELFFRDLTKFDDSYAEKYLDTPCRQWDARFDNLPVVDGRLWSRDGIECRLAFGRKTTGFTYIERGQSLEIVVCFADGCHGLILLTPDGITMDGCREVSYCTGTPEPDFTVTACESSFAMTKNGHPYTVGVCGRIAEAGNGWTLIPENGVLKLRMSL
ncbi:MAG: hypothetical protein MJ192_10325 [Clostridia bacterium]|nr:hypothetical protein [Clostridia bacterium]